jgi:hypothetical protein
MEMNIGKTISELRKMTVPELREKFAEVHGEACRSRHRQFLIKRIVWKIQCNALGDISERAKARALELAKDSDVRLTASKVNFRDCSETSISENVSFSNNVRLPIVGTIITRKYKGRLYNVKVMPKGFEFNGEIYRSLSAIAKAITGTNWNGYGFFKLNGNEND